MEAELKSIKELNSRLSSLIDAIESWDNTHNVLKTLPAPVHRLWTELRDLKQSSLEAEQLIREQNGALGFSRVVNLVEVGFGIEAIHQLGEEFKTLKQSSPGGSSTLNLQTFEKLRKDLLKCHNQVLRLVESLNQNVVAECTCTNRRCASSHYQKCRVISNPPFNGVCAMPQKGKISNPLTTRPSIENSNYTKHRSFKSITMISQMTQISRCDDTCACSCHADDIIKSSGRHTTITQQVRGGKRIVDCTEPTCRKLALKKRQITVRQSSVLKKEFALSVILRGPRISWQIKSRPIVPESSDAIKFSQVGDLNSLRKLILDGRASIFDTGPDGWSLLHNSVYNSHFETVKFLLECGADQEVSEIKFRKPSHFAKFKALTYQASDYQKQLSRLLSDDGDFRVDFELSPILSATLGEYDSADSERPSLDEIISFAKQLAAISLPVDWNSWKKVYANRSPLFLEVIHHFRSAYEKQSPPTKIFHDLLEQKDVIQHWTPVLWAAYMGREQQLISLLENGADPFYVTQLGGNIFHQAAESANINVLNYLLRHWLETPLHVAAERSATLVTALLQHGASMAARQGDGESPLHYPKHLSGQQRLQSLASLLAVLARGCPQIDEVDNLGCPPLFYFLDTPDCVKLLLDWAAGLTVSDHLGRNVLHHACLNDHSQSLSLLLDHCPLELINAKDRNGDTPLFTSLQNSSVYCSRILLRRAPVSQFADKRGWTLLHYIVKMSDVVCLDLALSIPGVDLAARTRQGQTAFDLTHHSKGSVKCMQEMLLKAMRQVGS